MYFWESCLVGRVWSSPPPTARRCGHLRVSGWKASVITVAIDSCCYVCPPSFISFLYLKECRSIPIEFIVPVMVMISMDPSPLTIVWMLECERAHLDVFSQATVANLYSGSNVCKDKILRKQNNIRSYLTKTNSILWLYRLKRGIAGNSDDWKRLRHKRKRQADRIMKDYFKRPHGGISLTEWMQNTGCRDLCRNTDTFKMCKVFDAA